MSGSDEINTILKDLPDFFDGSAPTPAANNLFNIRESAEKFNRSEAEQLQILTAQLVFLALRARPLILTTVSLLCTVDSHAPVAIFVIVSQLQFNLISIIICWCSPGALHGKKYSTLCHPRGAQKDCTSLTVNEMYMPFDFAVFDVLGNGSIPYLEHPLRDSNTFCPRLRFSMSLKLGKQLAIHEMGS
jgi:hypothetical protein